MGNKTTKQLRALEPLEYQKASNDTDSDLRGDHYVKVVKVYDGDTITVAFSSGEQASVRIAHIDCAEIRPSPSLTLEERECEEKKAKEAKDYLLDAFGPKMLCSVTVLKRDKYRRLLAEVYVINKKGKRLFRVSDEMIARKLALPYEGRGIREKTGWKLTQL